MKNLSKWIGRIALGIVGLLLLLVIGAGIWVMSQPSLPEGPLVLQQESLTSPTYREAADSALAMIQKVSVELGLPSVSVAVSIDNEVVWAAALGMADVGEGRAVNLETVYRSGSIAKSMTGLAAVKLVEEGKLELDRPVREYVPSFPEKRWEPTVRQLASHTGGIRHYSQPGHESFFGEQLSKHHYTSVEEALGLFKQDTLQYEPGTGFQYSTHGFTLLSAAMESASGSSYLDLVSELVWQPAGMSRTQADDLTKEIPNRIIPYVHLSGKLLHMEGPDPSYKWAGGGLLTTPTDLVKMGGAFMNGQLLQVDPLHPMFEPRPLADGSPNPQNYVLGWRHSMETDLLGTTDSLATVHHGGSSPGGNSFLLLVPAEKIAAATMTNLSIRNSWALRKSMYKIAGMFRARRVEKNSGRAEDLNFGLDQIDTK